MVQPAHSASDYTNKAISRQIRSIRWGSESMTNGGAVCSRGLVQSINNSIGQHFFVGKKRTFLRISAQNQQARLPNIKKYSATEKSKQCFQTQLSTKLIKVPSRWLIDVGTGVLAGSVGAIFDKLMEVYPHREISLTVMNTLLESLIVSAHYFSGLVNSEVESEDRLSPFASYFVYNLFMLTSLRGILLTLEHSKKPICKLIQKGIQTLYKVFFLQAMYDFFTSEEDASNKLITASNIICYTSATIISRKLTYAVVNPELFKTNNREDQPHETLNDQTPIYYSQSIKKN